MKTYVVHGEGTHGFLIESDYPQAKVCEYVGRNKLAGRHFKVTEASFWDWSKLKILNMKILKPVELRIV